MKTSRFLMHFLRVRKLRAAALLAASLIVSGTSPVLAQEVAELRIVDEFAPPGGLAIVQLELTEPQPISKGQMRVNFGSGPLVVVRRAVAFSLGSVQSTFKPDTGSITITLTSPDSILGTVGDLPIAAFAIQVSPTAQPGDNQTITIDPGSIEILDPDGQLYPTELKPGTFTVGGFSIDEMSPALGLIKAGEKVTFKGVGLPAALKIDIAGAQIASTKVLSAKQAEVTLAADFTIQETTRLRFEDPEAKQEKRIHAAILVKQPLETNSPPKAEDDQAETIEGQSVTIDVLSNDSDPERDTVTLSSVLERPAHGKAEISSNASVTYTPDSSFQGTDSFSYEVSDSKGATDSARVTIQVLPKLLQFELLEFSLISGTAEELILKLNREAVPGTLLQISASPEDVLGVPTSFSLAGGTGSVTLKVFGSQPGTAVLTAAVGQESATLTVQVLEGRVLEIPVLENSEAGRMGLAVTNRSEETAQVRLRCFRAADPASDFLSVKSLEFPLLPHSQRANLLSEFDPDLEGFQGWIELSSANPEVSAMFLNLTGTTGGFAGASSSERSTVFFFPQTRGSDDGNFRFSLINNNEAPAQVELSWQGTAEGLIEKQVVLAPQRSLISSLLEAFPELNGEETPDGYLSLRSSRPLSAYQQTETAFHLLGLRPPPLSAARSLLFLPQLAAAPDWSTEITLINTGETKTGATLTLVDDSQNPISAGAAANPVTIMLEPLQQKILSLAEVFGLELTESIRVGSLRIEAASPLVGAAVIAREAAKGPTAMVPLFSTPVTESIFAQAASGPFQGIDLFTGLAFQNPQEMEVDVTVRLFSPKGEVLGVETLKLKAGERVSKLLSEIIPNLKPFVSGYLQVTASDPLLMLEIFGDAGLNFLSTVDGSTP